MSKLLPDELKALLARFLAEGFDPAETLPSRAAEYLEGEYHAGQIEALAPALLAEVVREHQKDQRTWPAVTDCDRLDAAFEELNSLGIMARHHWYCCGNCGSSAMPHEFDRLGGEWEGVPIIGYAFYHVQDTEAAVEGYGICLGYGATECATTEAEYERKSLAIAATVCEVLRKHGLSVEWNEQIEKRILVRVDWKRRSRPPRFTEDWANEDQ
jgi:hypothetical protein